MWGVSIKTMVMVDSAKAIGLDIMMDRYLYTASSKGISVLIPKVTPVREAKRADN